MEPQAADLPLAWIDTRAFSPDNEQRPSVSKCLWPRVGDFSASPAYPPRPFAKWRLSVWVSIPCWATKGLQLTTQGAYSGELLPLARRAESASNMFTQRWPVNHSLDYRHRGGIGRAGAVSTQRRSEDRSRHRGQHGSAMMDHDRAVSGWTCFAKVESSW